LDHWVPDANKASTALVNEWAEKEKVEVSIDYITTQGNKLFLTIAAEGQANSAMTFLAMPTWWPHAHAELLEPVNDIMEPLIKQNAEVNGTVQYLGKAGDKWLGVPAVSAARSRALLPYRPDEKYAGIDVQEMYPAVARPRPTTGHGHVPQGGRSLQKGGFPFGIRVGETPDSVDTAGAFFLAFGAQLVDAKATSRSRPMRCGRLSNSTRSSSPNCQGPSRPLDDFYQQQGAGFRRKRTDHESAQRWPSPRRDAPQVAEQCWTHGFPAGRKAVCAVRPLLLDHMELFQE